MNGSWLGQFSWSAPPLVISCRAPVHPAEKLRPGGLGGPEPDRRFLPALTQTFGSLAVWSFLFLDLETLRGGGGVSSSF